MFDQMILRFAPILMTTSLLLVIGGAALMLYFGYEIFILLTTPEHSTFMTYVLGQLPNPSDATYTVSGNMDGKEFEMTMPANLLAYGRFLFAFLIWGMIGGVVTLLISGGISIFKVLTHVTKRQSLTQEETQNGSTRNSNYAR